MEYEWIGELQADINTMNANGEFIMPEPVEGPIPQVSAFKSQIKYPRVFKYGTDDHCVALDMYYYLMNKHERSFLRRLGIVDVTYISHAHGIAVGKALTEYLKQNALRL